MEGTCMPNHTAGFSRCVNKMQQDIQQNHCLLEQELGKGRSSEKVRLAHDEIKELGVFL